MIPKQLFFIWLGSKPKWVNYCVDNFKKVNPDYSIDLYEDDLKDPKTDLVKDLLYCCEKRKNKEEYNIANKDLENIFRFETSNTWTRHHTDFIYLIGNTLKVYLVYKYGGIYLDCDTFPVKPFEDWLLEKPFRSFYDNFMIGAPKNIAVYNNYTKDNYSSDFLKFIRTQYGYKYNDIKYKCPKLYSNCKLFLNCELKYGSKVLDDYSGRDYFLDHYIRAVRKSVLK